MARKANVFPSYLRHKQSGQARVRIARKDYLLGEYGSEKSRIRYAELVSKLAGVAPIDPFAKSNSGSLPRNVSEADPGLTIHELVLAFMCHADQHYIKDGEPTSEIHCLKSATRPLVDLYGFTAVDSFGPLIPSGR